MAMRGDRLEVNVTFDERGYIGSAPELRSPVMALSLGGLRRKVEALMMPDDVRVVLQLDGLAERAPAEGAGAVADALRTTTIMKMLPPGKHLRAGSEPQT
jgi:hypothetical protein